MKNTQQQGVWAFAGNRLILYEMQLIVLRRVVVFEFDAGTGEFSFEPIAIELVKRSAGKIDIDPCACLTPGTRNSS